MQGRARLARGRRARASREPQTQPRWPAAQSPAEDPRPARAPPRRRAAAAPAPWPRLARPILPHRSAGEHRPRSLASATPDRLRVGESKATPTPAAEANRSCATLAAFSLDRAALLLGEAFDLEFEQEAHLRNQSARGTNLRRVANGRLSGRPKLVREEHIPGRDPLKARTPATMGRGEYGRTVAPRSDTREPSPCRRLDDPFAGIRKLMSDEISSRQLILPLLGRATSRPTLQRSGSRSTGRIDDAHRNPLACLADGESEIAVVRYNDGGIDMAEQRV